ncbi:MAG: hypothetical protein GY798_33670 [Hyphomicrobiales bacterium]|nr:hypothetical protein [Hyphomicrobiales bacterium]
MPKVRASGARGSWFAKVEGETLPCVHAHWFRGDRYDDPQLRPGDPKSEELTAALRASGRAILTNDEPTDGADGIEFKRTGYIAVFSVDDIELDQAGLRFRFVERLTNLN